MLWLLSASVVALASVTAYFVVFGLAALAPQVSVPMIALGLSLELSKYSAVTFTYMHWATLPWRLRYALLTVIVSVVGLSSSGVFGYLQASFSQSLSKGQAVDLELAATVVRRGELEAQVQQIAAEVRRTPENVVRSRIALIREYDARRTVAEAELQTLRQREQELRVQQLEARAHTGPLAYLAQALGVPVENAVLWMALLLTISLDPLALLLSLCLVYARALHVKAASVPLEDRPEFRAVVENLRNEVPPPTTPYPPLFTAADAEEEQRRAEELRAHAEFYRAYSHLRTVPSPYASPESVPEAEGTPVNEVDTPTVPPDVDSQTEVVVLPLPPTPRQDEPASQPGPA